METFRLQHNKAMLHTTFATTEYIAKFSWTVLLHLPYSSVLEGLDLISLSLWKMNYMDGQHFSDKDAATVAVTKKWLVFACSNFYKCGIQALTHHWKSCIKNGGDYVEK